MDHARSWRLVTLAAGVILIAALYFARDILVPFALAVVLSFLLGPVVLRLQRWRVPRAVAVVLTVLLVFAAIGGVGWLVAGQVQQLAAKLPEYRQSIRARVTAVRELVEASSQATQEVQDVGADIEAAAQSETPSEIETVRIAEPESGPLATVLGLLSPTVDLLLTAGLAMIFAFVMLLRRGDLRDRFIQLSGKGRILVTTQALDEAAHGVSAYLGRLLLLNGLYGLSIIIGLALIGVPNALLFGTLAALLRFIPYLGPWIAASFPILTSLAASTGWTQPLLVMGLIAALELLHNVVLEPWIYGQGTGLSRLALLMSTLFWTWLWGPVGLVLSTPFMVCLVVMGKHVAPLRFLNLMFSETPGLPPPERLYQRLLADAPDLAWEVIAGELKSKELLAVYDEVMLPALSMAETDRALGTLDDEARSHVEGVFKLLLNEAGEPAVASGATAVEPTPGARPAPAVLCLPARDSADVLAATMLAQLLRREGLAVEVAPLEALSGEVLHSLDSGAVNVICISAVPPSRFLYVRYLCKRIATRHSTLPIVVGLWGQTLDEPQMAEHVPSFDSVQAVTSFAEAVPLVRRLAETARDHRVAGVARAPGSPPG